MAQRETQTPTPAQTHQVGRHLLARQHLGLWPANSFKWSVEEFQGLANEAAKYLRNTIRC